MQFLRHELNLFFVAMVFFTRLPAPSWVDHRTSMLQQSRRYFPVMGWLVGALSGGMMLAGNYLWPVPVAILLGMAVSVLITGAFHEDGFCDACDGFGGGWTPAQVLTIMKDSRVGAYGAVGIILLLLIKFQLLTELATLMNIGWRLILLLISAHSLSRFAASLVAQYLPYVQDPDKSKIRPIASTPLSKGAMLFSLLLALLPQAFLFPYIPVWACFPPLLSAYPMALYFRKRIGGYTGDCLGAVQQVSELVYYLTILALWK